MVWCIRAKSSPTHIVQVQDPSVLSWDDEIDLCILQYDRALSKFARVLQVIGVIGIRVVSCRSEYLGGTC
jgi:hypothetical protein